MMHKELRKQAAEINQVSENKIAILVVEPVEHGYQKNTMHYPSGKTYTEYLSPENINRQHDLRNQMAAWAEDRGFVVVNAF